ncbi:MAG: hypothetical protein P1V18_02510 [Candidatus Gracilibacteria bacterium]|nr:hypothetical protein [Candidatus Gracilibacteria bacterium]
MNKNLFSQPILTQLKNPALLIAALGFAVLFFDLQLWMMWNLPGYESEMCVMGAGLKPDNIIYAIVMSLLFGMFLMGFYTTLKVKQASLGGLSLSTAAMALGTLTVICASCTFQAISIFGFVIGVHFLTDLNIWFKLISFMMMLLGIYQVNKQLKGECSSCVK